MRVTPEAAQQDEVVASRSRAAAAAGLLRGPVQVRLAPQAERGTTTDPLPSDWSRVGGGQMPDVVGESDTSDAICRTELCPSEFCVTENEDCKSRPTYTHDCPTPTVGCPPCT